MNQPMARKAGSAFAWKTIHQGAEKAIYLIRLVVLAWLLSPDDFGLLAVSMVAVDVLTKLTDVGMIPALIQSRDASGVHYDTAWTIGLARSILVAAVVMLVAPHVAAIFSEPRAIPLIRLLALKPVLEAAASIRAVDLTRELRFKELTIIQCGGAIANTVVSIALASSYGVWALVAGYVCGPFVVLVLSYILAPYRPRIKVEKDAARSLAQFGRWVFLSGIVIVAGSSILRWVISFQLGTQELGLYFLATRLAFLPANLAVSIVGDVSFPLYARLQEHIHRVSRSYRSVLSGLVVAMIPVYALLITVTPVLVEQVLGPRWQGTVSIIRILAVVGLIGMLGDTIVPVLKGVGRPSRVFVIECVQTVGLVGGIWFFTAVWGLEGAAVAWLPAVLLSQVFGVVFLRQILDDPFRKLWKTVGTIALVSILASFGAKKVVDFVPGIAGLIVALVGAMLLIAWMLRLLDRRWSLGLFDDLLKAFPRLKGLLSSTG